MMTEPLITRPWDWSIGIYAGSSLERLRPLNGDLNPVLTAADVSDMSAAMVADPFMIQKNGSWYMFFEIWPTRGERGVIGLATSEDGHKWSYEKIVLSEAFHLSYPYVFQAEGQYYMIPESSEAHSVRLYRAIEFPDTWKLESVLLPEAYHDATVFQHGGIWWMYASFMSDRLHLFFSEKLTDGWREHPMSPIMENKHRHCRPAGRVQEIDGRLIRFAQDPIPIYGSRVWAFQVTTLTPDHYEEHLMYSEPVLAASGKGWNAKGMHHLDLRAMSENKWMACVDGCSGQRTLLRGRDARGWMGRLAKAIVGKH